MGVWGLENVHGRHMCIIPNSPFLSQNNASTIKKKTFPHLTVLTSDFLCKQKNQRRAVFQSELEFKFKPSALKLKAIFDHEDKHLYLLKDTKI